MRVCEYCNGEGCGECGGSGEDVVGRRAFLRRSLGSIFVFAGIPFLAPKPRPIEWRVGEWTMTETPAGSIVIGELNAIFKRAYESKLSESIPGPGFERYFAKEMSELDAREKELEKEEKRLVLLVRSRHAD